MSFCFIDLDGCVVDFVRGAFKLHGKSLPWEEIRWGFDAQLGLSPTEFWSPMKEEFWASLDKTSECHSVLETVNNYFKPENTFLMSSPCRTPGCLTGKARWVEKYMPAFSRRCLLTNVKEIMAARGRVLIDDSQANVDLWRAHGGSAFLFPRPWNSAAKDEAKAVEKLNEFLKNLV